MYVSPTDLGPLALQDKGHTFSSLTVLDDGSCIAAERRGARNIEAKGLLVRYPNPFAGGGTPEVLLEANDAIRAAAQTPSGAWLALTSKKLYQQEKAWKALTPKLSGFVSFGYVALASGVTWVGDHSRVHRLRGTIIDSFEFDLLRNVFSDGVRIYAVGRRAKGGIEQLWVGHADCEDLEPVFDHVAKANVTWDGALLIHGDDGQVHHGSVGAFRVIGHHKTHLDRMVFAVGETFLVNSGLVSHLVDGQPHEFMRATGWLASAIEGNKEVLWIANGTELLCFNGKEWRATFRVHHDTGAKQASPAVKPVVVQPSVPSAAKRAQPIVVECIAQPDAWNASLVNGMTTIGEALVVVGSKTLRSTSQPPVFQTLSLEANELTCVSAHADRLLVGSSGVVFRSLDGGRTFERLETGTTMPVTAVLETEEGLWLGLHSGEVLFRRHGSDAFVELEKPRTKRINALLNAPQGVMVLRSDGRLELVQKNKLVGRLAAGFELYGGCVTQEGTLVVTGAKGALWSSDGKSFTTSVGATQPMYAASCTQDGRIITGGEDDQLFASDDDGRTFSVVDHPFRGAKRAFSALSELGGSLYATGSFQALLRVRV